MRDDFPGYDGLELAVLRRYIAGHSDAAERRRVDAWAAEAVSRRRYLAAMRQLYERDSAETRDETVAMWDRIAAHMDTPGGAAEASTYVAPWEKPAVRVDVRRQTPRVLGGAFASRRRWPVALGAAAALMLTVGGGALLLRSHLVPSAPAVGMRQIATAKGQRVELQLSDGSRVVLGPDSRLRFPTEFATGSRNLQLEGIAYFDVAHDASRPFLVHTRDAIAEDIGTRFVVTAYPESHTTQVVVSEGEVALQATRAPVAARVVLTKGQLGRLVSSDGVPSVSRVDPSRYDAWTRGELMLRDTPLAEAAAELSRWYDGEVRLGDSSLAGVPLTASFTAESFREAVNVIATVAPVRAVWQGHVVTLYRR